MAFSPFFGCGLQQNASSGFGVANSSLPQHLEDASLTSLLLLPIRRLAATSACIQLLHTIFRIVTALYSVEFIRSIIHHICQHLSCTYKNLSFWSSKSHFYLNANLGFRCASFASIALSLSTHCPCGGHWVGNDRAMFARKNYKR